MCILSLVLDRVYLCFGSDLRAAMVEILASLSESGPILFSVDFIIPTFFMVLLSNFRFGDFFFFFFNYGGTFCQWRKDIDWQKN